MDPERLSRLTSKFDVHNFPVRGQVSHIHDNIYLSDITFGKDVQKIVAQKFEMVMNISEAPIPTYTSSQMVENGIEYHYINVDHDDPNTDMKDAMKEALVHYRTNAKTLFHCSAGCSRSVAVVIYILCKQYGFSIEGACDLLVRQRPCVSPMPNYLIQVEAMLTRDSEKLL